MTTRMAHPEHGFTHAYDASEIKRLESFGWKVEAPEADLPVIEDTDEPGRPAKRRGRPPKAQ